MLPGGAGAAAAQRRSAGLPPHPVQHVEPQHQEEAWGDRSEPRFIYFLFIVQLFRINLQHSDCEPFSYTDFSLTQSIKEMHVLTRACTQCLEGVVGECCLADV